MHLHAVVCPTGLQLLHRLVAQLAILREGLGAEVYVAVLSNVSVTVLDQALNNINNSVQVSVARGCTVAFLTPRPCASTKYSLI